jgi:hypothetical protein
MLGDLIRKLLNKDQPGLTRTTPKDASQLPSGMNFDRQPMSIPQGFGGTNPPLPRGMDFSRRFMNVPRDEGIRNVSGGDLQGSLSDYYRLKY